MKNFIIFKILFSCVFAYAQDVSNAYIKNIQFRWDDVRHDATHCGGDPGNESAEWKVRPYVYDNIFVVYRGYYH